MKTSELRKIVEEHGYTFQKTDQFIFISYYGLEKMKLDLQDHSITVDKNTILVTQSIKKIMVALIEYSLTPPSEREDEKKYKIEFNTDNLDIATCYLYKMATGKLVLYDVIKHSFTQQEIDNLPKEIKGAIECGFLRKVEVE